MSESCSSLRVLDADISRAAGEEEVCVDRLVAQHCPVKWSKTLLILRLMNVGPHCEDYEVWTKMGTTTCF